MPSIFICQAEISDNCTNLTVWGIKHADKYGKWVCTYCRPHVRQAVFKLIVFADSQEDSDVSSD